MSDTEDDVSSISDASSVSSISVSDSESDSEIEIEPQPKPSVATFTEAKQGAAGNQAQLDEALKDFENSLEYNSKGEPVKMKADKDLLFKVNFIIMIKSLLLDANPNYPYLNINKEIALQNQAKIVYNSLVTEMVETKLISRGRAIDMVNNLNGACFAASHLFIDTIKNKKTSGSCQKYIKEVCTNKNLKILLRNITDQDIAIYYVLLQFEDNSFFEGLKGEIPAKFFKNLSK